MNILYMHSHDTGRYIQPYGYNIPTPNLMDLARNGTLFRNAYAVGATCCPSRSGLLTGTMPHSNGMTGHTSRGFGLNDYSKHIVDLLNNNGYETVLSGIQHVADDVEKIGYKKIITDERNTNKTFPEFDSIVATNAAQYIMDKSDDSPFFLSCGFHSTHRVKSEFPRSDGKVEADYIKLPEKLYDHKENRQEFAGFVTMAKHMDNCLGRVIEALRKSGHDKNTIVIYTTDHGIAFPQMKNTLYDSGIGVSLIIDFPQNKLKGNVVDSLVSHLDIYPTLCELLNIRRPNWLQGRSMMPLLNGISDEIRTEIFAEINYHACYEPIRCIRTKRYKFIKYFGEYNKYMPAHIPPGFERDWLVENNIGDKEKDMEQLYDLRIDSCEKNNLINSEDYKDIMVELKKRLRNWMEETNDPLLDGDVPKPKGARINKLGTLSAFSKEYIREEENEGK